MDGDSNSGPVAPNRNESVTFQEDKEEDAERRAAGGARSVSHATTRSETSAYSDSFEQLGEQSDSRVDEDESRLSMSPFSPMETPSPRSAAQKSKAATVEAAGKENRGAAAGSSENHQSPADVPTPTSTPPAADVQQQQVSQDTGGTGDAAKDGPSSTGAAGEGRSSTEEDDTPAWLADEGVKASEPERRLDDDDNNNTSKKGESSADARTPTPREDGATSTNDAATSQQQLDANNSVAATSVDAGRDNHSPDESATQQFAAQDPGESPERVAVLQEKEKEEAAAPIDAEEGSGAKEGDGRQTANVITKEDEEEKQTHEPVNENNSTPSNVVEEKPAAMKLRVSSAPTGRPKEEEQINDPMAEGTQQHESTTESEQPQLIPHQPLVPAQQSRRQSHSARRKKGTTLCYKPPSPPATVVCRRDRRYWEATKDAMKNDDEAWLKEREKGWVHVKSTPAKIPQYTALYDPHCPLMHDKKRRKKCKKLTGVQYNLLWAEESNPLRVDYYIGSQSTSIHKMRERRRVARDKQRWMDEQKENFGQRRPEWCWLQHKRQEKAIKKGKVGDASRVFTGDVYIGDDDCPEYDEAYSNLLALDEKKDRPARQQHAAAAEQYSEDLSSSDGDDSSSGDEEEDEEISRWGVEKDGAECNRGGSNSTRPEGGNTASGAALPPVRKTEAAELCQRVLSLWQDVEDEAKESWQAYKLELHPSVTEGGRHIGLHQGGKYGRPLRRRGTDSGDCGFTSYAELERRTTMEERQVALQILEEERKEQVKWEEERRRHTTNLASAYRVKHPESTTAANTKQVVSNSADSNNNEEDGEVKKEARSPAKGSGPVRPRQPKGSPVCQSQGAGSRRRVMRF